MKGWEKGRSGRVSRVSCRIAPTRVTLAGAVLGVSLLAGAPAEYARSESLSRVPLGISIAEFGASIVGPTAWTATVFSGSVLWANGLIRDLGLTPPALFSRDADYVALTALVLMTPMFAASGAFVGGNMSGQNGTLSGAVIGALCGTAAGCGVGTAVGCVGQVVLRKQAALWAMPVGTLLGNSVGAVIGYNISRKYRIGKAVGRCRLEPPQLAWRAVPHHGAASGVSLDLRLVRARL